MFIIHPDTNFVLLVLTVVPYLSLSDSSYRYMKILARPPCWYY